MRTPKPFILLLAAAMFAATLTTGCAPKISNPLSMEIALTDEILEPGQDAILTVSIYNNDTVDHTLQAPGPETVKIYASVVNAEGLYSAAGSLEVEVDAMGAETEVVPAGSSLETTLAIVAGPAEAGDYRLVATYKSMAEAKLLLATSNSIGVLVE